MRAGVVAVVVLVAVVGMQLAPVIGMFGPTTDGTASAAPGDVEWSYSADGSVKSPAVADGTVYMVSSNKTYALDADTGNEEWTYSPSSRSFSAGATVADGTVYVGSNDNSLHAIDADTGTKNWNHSVGATRNPPTVAGGTVYVGSDDNNLYALDADTGNEEWTYTTGDRVRTSPNVVNGTVYFGSYDATVYAVDADTGNEEWSYSPSYSGITSSPTVANGTLYFGNGDYNVYAVDAETGSKEWSTSTNSVVGSSPTVVNGTVYIGSRDDNLYALDADTGNEEWTYTADNEVRSSPTVVDGTVYVGSRDTNLYAVDADTGNKEWTYTTGDRVKHSPTVANGKIYVGSEDTNLYALDIFATGPTNYGSRILHGTLGHNDQFTADGSISGGGGETLSGTVTDAAGSAIENATVKAVNASTGATEATATTDGNGYYEMLVADGDYDVTASKSGYSPRTKSVTVAGDTTLNFTLTSDTRISDPDPPDGATVSEPPVQLSVLANSTNQSVESIDVEFYEQTNGTVNPETDTEIGSETVSPGERASVTWGPGRGTFEWYAVGTADSGARDTGGPYTLGIGEADIIDGSEQPPDGSNVSPTDNVDLAVDVRVDNNATVEFYDAETGDPSNDPLIGSQSVSSGTTTASARWYSDERSANEEWYAVLKDSTGTRDRAGTFAFGAGGQVVARDADTGQIIDDRTVRFDATYPGGSETFDRSPGTLDLSKSSAEEGDRIRIEVRAQNYYPTTVEVPNKQADADIYLERGTNYSSSPSSDDPDNTASVEDDPERYLSRFELQDRTGRYPPPNTTLALRIDVDGDGQTDLVHRSSFGAANRVGARVKQDRQYQLVIENDDGDERRLGAWTALGDQLVELQVRAFDFDIPEQGGGYVSQASVEDVDDENETELLRWQFSDPDEATSRLEVAIYEQDNRSNGLLNRTYTDLGNASYTERLTGNQTGKAWVIELNGTRNGERFTSRQVVGETDLAPGIPLDPFYQEMFAVLFLLVLAGVFGGVRAEAGAIIVPMTAGVLFWMGWLPGVVTAGAIAVALFVAVLYRIRATPQPGVR